MECQPQETAVLIIDGPYAQSLTAGGNGRPRITLDYQQFIDWCFVSAGISQRGYTYYITKRPQVSPELAVTKEGQLALARRHAFHNALRKTDVYVGEYNEVRGAIPALLVNLILNRPDVTHYILVAADPAFSMVLMAARDRGIYITLICQEHEVFLRKACNTTKFITTTDLNRMARTKVAVDHDLTI